MFRLAAFKTATTLYLLIVGLGTALLRVAEQARTSRETAEIAWRQAHEHDAR